MRAIRWLLAGAGTAMVLAGCAPPTTGTTTTTTTTPTPQLVVSPAPTGLSATEATPVQVSGTGFLPGTSVALLQCADRPGTGTCLGKAEVAIGPDGSFPPEPITLSYQLMEWDPLVLCDSDPAAGLSCYLTANYMDGPAVGTVGATAPVSFLVPGPG